MLGCPVRNSKMKSIPASKPRLAQPGARCGVLRPSWGQDAGRHDKGSQHLAAPTSSLSWLLHARGVAEIDRVEPGLRLREGERKERPLRVHNHRPSPSPPHLISRANRHDIIRPDGTSGSATLSMILLSRDSSVPGSSLGVVRGLVDR